MRDGTFSTGHGPDGTDTVEEARMLLIVEQVDSCKTGSIFDAQTGIHLSACLHKLGQ